MKQASPLPSNQGVLHLLTATRFLFAQKLFSCAKVQYGPERGLDFLTLNHTYYANEWSLLLYLLLPVGWSSCCQNMGQQGSLCSLSAWRLVLQQLQPSSRHPFAKIALPSLLFFLPIAFFIRLNSNHPLRLSSGPFLRIILPNPPGWVMYGLIPTYFTCLCQLPPKDGVTCVSPA